MREVLIVLLIAAASYLAYDDFYKQRHRAAASTDRNSTTATKPSSRYCGISISRLCASESSQSPRLVSETSGTRLELGHVAPAYSERRKSFDATALSSSMVERGEASHAPRFSGAFS